MDAQEVILRVTQQIHHPAHPVQLKKAVAVVQVALHAEINKAVNKIQGFLI
jgi:hypothetical protein